MNIGPGANEELSEMLLILENIQERCQYVQRHGELSLSDMAYLGRELAELHTEFVAFSGALNDGE